MRDPKRIPLVLEVLRLAWEKAPDLRLGQLILNTRVREVSNGDSFGELYNREDERMIEEIIKLYGS